MPESQGKFQYRAQDGTVAQEGACRVRFDAQTLMLTPASGAALVFDLGDLDAVTAADWEVRLPLYTGRTIVLRQLGKAYDTFAHDLLEAYRNRTVQCLLLEDMGEIARFTGNFEVTSADSRGAMAEAGVVDAGVAAAGAAEIRLYKSNLAVLPVAAKSFQWRLADIDEVTLDAAEYQVVLRAGDQSLKVTRLAKRTEEFATAVNEAVNVLATQSAEALHGMLPFLDPDQLQSCASLLREGRSAPLAKLAAIHKQIPVALAANAVDKDLKPYYEHLLALAADRTGYAGFKLIRPEDHDGSTGQDAAGAQDSDSGADDAANAPDADASAPETLYWFLFPLAAKGGGSELSNVVAWEASSRSGRATYFFRLVDPARAAELSDPAKAASIVDSAVRRLNLVLAMLNFRRRPIYLSDDELAMDPRFHRYAIAARRLPEVREVRANFLGRALHSSLEAWQVQVATILEKA
jgi:hypothetical protein